TGLPNKALFMDRLERVIARRPRRPQGFVAVLFIDIDDFKVVNDTLGHAAGDLLLAEVGRRLTSSLGPADTPARFGGDEFTILLQDLSGPDEALRAAARIGENASEPVRIGERDVTVTVSVGISTGSGENLRATELVSQADIAMYRAKENGKARAELFDAEMGAEAWRRLNLQSDLRHAIERHELAVHFQPILDLKTGELSQVEALVRWVHPERGLLLPAEFVPFAEMTGMISHIDRFVLEESCRQFALWQRRFPWARQLQVAVNMSPRELRQPDLAADVARVLSENGVAPSRLVLEITESSSLIGSDTVRAVLDRLHRLGVQLVVDDFGVGYSGLDHFKSFKVDGLKIDRTFVAGIPHQPEDTAIVTATLAFARALGLSVVAEGIETDRQLSALSALGCERGQGRLLSPPVRAGAMATMLRSRRTLLPQTRRPVPATRSSVPARPTRNRPTGEPRGVAPPVFG
ncbi:MAG TPA: bifunctional diguanylate cyclase/phosphodiesterase, partial [Candidatus Limnocylindrales bacterium]|nr:bifunctional diguanylate cyclase/phosphodiesterase [Candidatus Limnocylindrales bacterium]